MLVFKFKYIILNNLVFSLGLVWGIKFVGFIKFKCIKIKFSMVWKFIYLRSFKLFIFMFFVNVIDFVYFFRLVLKKFEILISSFFLMK